MLIMNPSVFGAVDQNFVVINCCEGSFCYILCTFFNIHVIGIVTCEEKH